MGKRKSTHPHEWRDEETVRELYLEQGLDPVEIGDRLDCSARTARKWIKKHGMQLETPNAEKPPYYATTTNGYEHWQNKFEGETDTVKVHRLAAVAWFGWDAVADNVVHHRTDIPWDNREENLAPMARGEHQTMHLRERWD